MYVCMYVWTGSRTILPGNVMVKFITESGAALTKIADVNSNLVCMYVCERGGCGGHLLVEDAVGEERVVVDAENLHRGDLILPVTL